MIHNLVCLLTDERSVTIKMWSSIVLSLISLSGLAVAVSPLVQLAGKPLLKGKVFSPGYSIPAKSLGQCMDACNTQTATCDGVVYHEVIGKCRMVNKCAAAVQVDNSSAVVYFSKRPLSKFICSTFMPASVVQLVRTSSIMSVVMGSSPD